MISEKKAKKTFFRSTSFNLLLSLAGIACLVMALLYFMKTAFQREIKGAEDKTMLLVSTLRSDLELSYARFENDMRFKVSYVPLAKILEDREISFEDILPLRRLYSIHHEIISRIWVLSPEMKGRCLTCGKDNYFKISEVLDYGNSTRHSDDSAADNLKIPYYDNDGKLLYYVLVEVNYKNFVNDKMRNLSFMNPDAWIFYMSPSGKMQEVRHSQMGELSFDLESGTRAEIFADAGEGYDGTIENKSRVDNVNIDFISSFSPLKIGAEKGWVMVSLEKNRVLSSVYRVLVTVSSLFFLALLIIIFVFGYFIVNIRRASKALKESEKRWIFAVEGSGDGVWDWNAVTDEVYYSRRWKEIIGYSDDEIGNSISEWKTRIHPDDIKKAEEALNYHFAGETEIYSSEHRIRSKSGNYKWILDRGMVIDRDAKGSPLRMIGTHSDITQRKNAEEEIRRLSERLDLAIKSSGIGVWDWDIMEDRLIWDDRMRSLYGIETPGLPAKMGDWMDMIDSGDRKRVMKGIENSTGNRRYFNDEFKILAQDGESRFIKADARVFLNDSGVPYRAVGVSYDITKRKNIEAELKRNSETANLIARMSTHFINIDSSSIDCAISLSLGSIGSHLAIDSLRLFMLSENLDSATCANEWSSSQNNDCYLIRKTFQMDADSPWMHTLKEYKHIYIRNFSQSPKGEQDRWQFLREGGNSSILMLPLAWKNKLEGFICFARKGEWILDEGEISLLQMLEDIFLSSFKRKDVETALLSNREMLRIMNDTLEHKVEERSNQLKETQSQLFLQEKMASIGQLAAGIAHEINNPASFVATNFATLVDYARTFKQIIMEYRQLLSEMEKKGVLESSGFLDSYRRIAASEDDSSIDYIFGDIEKLSEESGEGFSRISGIVSSMSDFSRADKSGEMISYNINTGIKDTLIIARHAYKYHADIDLELGDVPDIFCYPGQLNQVFLNLVVNSAHAIAAVGRGTKGKIAISTWSDDKSVYCRISDNGIGIKPEDKNRIFEPFFTTKEPGKGTGLGLSISYDIIVNKHKGTITVESEEGKGTQFLVAIPIRKS